MRAGDAPDGSDGDKTPDYAGAAETAAEDQQAATGQEQAAGEAGWAQRMGGLWEPEQFSRARTTEKGQRT